MILISGQFRTFAIMFDDIVRMAYLLIKHNTLAGDLFCCMILRARTELPMGLANVDQCM